MNDRMEQEIRRTILRLQASMPEPRDRQTPVFTLLRIAAGEINAGLLLGLFAGALIFIGTCSPAASVCANWKLRFRIPIRKC